MHVQRNRIALTLLTLVVSLAALTSTAGATVTTTFTTQLSDASLGAHSDLTVNLGFDYGADDPTAYPDGNFRESVQNMVVDIPAGMVGNPNAIPMADRCDPVTFETGFCPDSSSVGEIGLQATLVGTDSHPPRPGLHALTLDFGPPDYSYGYTSLSLLKTDPEVPATFGIYIELPFNFPVVRQLIRIGPDTKSDLKLRTETLDPINHTLITGTGAPGNPITKTYLRVDRLTLIFLGKLANGNNFMTNPTSCEQWRSTAYVNAYYNNTNLDADPLGTGTNDYNKVEAPEITPDCGNVADVPFPISGATTISSNARDVSPDFDFTITDPGVQVNGQVSSTPKKIVTTVPASINVDIQQLGRICENDQFKADTCPDSTKVGTVAIETPLITAGLSGDVYLVRNPKNTLPDLGMHIRGAIHFTQLGENHYVGVNGNQIQTTFDNIPAVGFSKLNVHLFGGPNGLLRSLKCPTSNKQPVDGSFSYSFTAYSGATNASTTDLSGTPCFGIQKLRTFQCVYRLLRFQPTYTSRARVKKVVLYVDGKKVKTVSKGKFQFRVPATRFTRGRHKFELRATYDDGTVSKKKSHFTRC